MSVRIRLQRHGKKGQPFYHIVVADQRAKRDGKFIEKLGTYNPMTNPAQIVLDVDKAVDWMEKGAQPSDTAKAILSYKGALYKKHLRGGLAKGAFDEEELQKRFDKWLDEKENRINNKVEKLAKSKEEKKKVSLEAERKASEARLAAEQPEEEVTENAEAAVEDQGAENTPSDDELQPAEAKAEEKVAEGEE